MKPTITSHIDLIRQTDGSYTGFEIADSSPNAILSVTPHFEKKFTDCLGSSSNPSSGSPAPVTSTAAPISSNRVVAKTSEGRYLEASLFQQPSPQPGPSSSAIRFTSFDAQHQFLSSSTFSPPPVQLSPGALSGELFISLSIVDVDRDGVPDVVALSSVSFSNNTGFLAVRTFRGHGTAFFDAGPQQLIAGVAGFAGAAGSLRVVDMNGDGLPDLVVQGTSSLTISYASAPGVFGLGTNVPLTVPLFNTSIGISDLNRDGLPDIVLSGLTQSTSSQAQAGAVQILLAGPQASFSQKVISLQPGLVQGSFPPAIAIGDLNGDLFPDIALSTGAIFYGDGTGEFPERKYFAMTGSGDGFVTDFNNDGTADVVFGGGTPDVVSGSYSNNTVTVLVGVGKGAFLSAPFTASPLANLGNFGTVFASADFDRDSSPDVATINGSFSSIDIAVLGRASAEGFSPVAETSFPHAPGFSLISAAAADFNADGIQDIAVLSRVYPSGTELQVFLGKGDGHFSPPVTNALPINAAQFVIADVNGDDKPDIAYSADNVVSVALGTGTGALGTPTFSATLSPLINGATPALAFVDQNGDHNTDLVILDAGGGIIYAFPGKGDGRFDAAITTPLPFKYPGLGPVNAAFADFNGDGLTDLLLPDFVAGGVRVLLGRKDLTFPESRTSPGYYTSRVYTADVNGDHAIDLVTQSTSTAAGVIVRLGRGDGTFEPELAMLIQFSGDIVVADLNHDNRPEIILATSAGVGTLFNLSNSGAYTVVSAAGFQQGSLAPGEIASIFGSQLAPTLASANPLADSLSGITVSVKDAAGSTRRAQLFYVSFDQINFIVPPGTAPGPATITVEGTVTGQPVSVMATIVTIAPTLFTLPTIPSTFPNQGAGYLLQVDPAGNQTIIALTTTAPGSTTGSYFPNTIDVTRPGTTYLVLYGTGFAAATSSTLTATVQGKPVQVTYAGPASAPGLDQVNLILPSSLAGAGVSTVLLGSGGIVSNRVLVSIR